MEIDRKNPKVCKEKIFAGGSSCINEMLFNLTNDWEEVSSSHQYPSNTSQDALKGIIVNSHIPSLHYMHLLVFTSLYTK